MKKESTNSGGNDDDPPTSSSSKPKDIIHDDVCSICMDDVSMLDINKFFRCSQCSKVMHMKCGIQLVSAKGLSDETRRSCPMCRAPILDEGSKEHIERLQRWIKLGKPWAQYSLGDLYSVGLGVKQDPKRAFELYKIAADHGHHHAQFNLGVMYAKGQGVIQSDTLSFKYTKLCAEQGVAQAQFDVATLYDSGELVEQSDSEAFKFYKLAAEQGHARAQCNLGNMYANGEGVIQSVTLAFKFYKLAAEGGDVQAQTRVGSYYAIGKGVTQSLTKAREWTTKAAKQGQEEAIHVLKILDKQEGRTSSSNFTDNNSTVLCSKCNKPAQTIRTLRNCRCKSAQYCNNTYRQAHLETIQIRRIRKSIQITIFNR